MDLSLGQTTKWMNMVIYGITDFRLPAVFGVIDIGINRKDVGTMNHSVQSSR